MWKRIFIVLSIIIVGISVFAIVNIAQGCQEPYILIKPEQVPSYIDSKVKIALGIDQFLGDWAKSYFPTVDFNKYDVYYSDEDIYVIVQKDKELSGNYFFCGQLKKYDDKIAIIVDVVVEY